MIGYRFAMLDHLRQLHQRPVTVALLIGLATQLFFMVHLGRPSVINFDEIHYVPAARSLLALDIPRNTEHPLVAKELIALGIALLGDNAWGWRIMPSIAGSATVVGIFAVVWMMLGRMRWAVLAALFTDVPGYSRVFDRGFVAYGTAKAALAHWTKMAAQDLSPRIRVNGIYVGSIMTSALEMVAGDPNLMGQLEGKTPLGRVGEPADIAAGVLYLSSRAGQYLTGKLIEIDGGIQQPTLDLGFPDVSA